MTDPSAVPSTSKNVVKAFILARNEAPNIGRCLGSLEELPVQVTVLLDRSATDETAQLAADFSNTKVVEYNYLNHCEAYNKICTSLAAEAGFCVVLDADMVVTKKLFAEVSSFMDQAATEVVRAPVLMHAEGRPLRWGSLYPPKPFAFRYGREYFVATGHGEELVGDCRVRQTGASLIHDDRKSFAEFLASQYGYSLALVSRSERGSLTWRDKLRLSTPIMLLGTPLYSYLGRLGLLSGRAGLIYALDRLIAEAVMFRQSLAAKLGAGDRR